MTSVAPEPTTIPGQVNDRVVVAIIPETTPTTAMHNNQTSDNDIPKPLEISTNDSLNKLRDLFSSGSKVPPDKTIKHFPLDDKGMISKPQFQIGLKAIGIEVDQAKSNEMHQRILSKSHQRDLGRGDMVRVFRAVEDWGENRQEDEENSEIDSDCLLGNRGLVGPTLTFNPIKQHILTEAELQKETTEVAYVPVTVASSQVNQVIGKMATMKEEHVELMNRLQKYFGEIESDTQTYYVTFLQQFKNKSVAAVKRYKLMLQNAEHALVAHERDAKERQESLEEHLAKFVDDNAETVKVLEERYEAERKRLEEERVSMIEQQMKELERRQHDFDTKTAEGEQSTKEQLQISNELMSMQKEDAAGVSLRSAMNHDVLANAAQQKYETQSMELEEKNTRIAMDLSAAEIRRNVLQNDKATAENEIAKLTVMYTEAINLANTMASAAEEREAHEIRAAVNDLVDRTVAAHAKAVAVSKHSNKRSPAIQPVQEATMIQTPTTTIAPDISVVEVGAQPPDSNLNTKSLETEPSGSAVQANENSVGNAEMEMLKQELALVRQEKEKLEVMQTAVAREDDASAQLQELQNKMLAMQEEAKTKVDLVVALNFDVTRLEEQVKAAEDESKKAKGIVRKWVADFQAENGKAPERSDMQAVKSIYVEVKKADNKLKTVKKEKNEKKKAQVDALAAVSNISIDALPSASIEPVNTSVTAPASTASLATSGPTVVVTSNEEVTKLKEALARAQQETAQLRVLQSTQPGTVSLPSDGIKSSEPNDERIMQYEIQIQQLQSQLIHQQQQQQLSDDVGTSVTTTSSNIAPTNNVTDNTASSAELVRLRSEVARLTTAVAAQEPKSTSTTDSASEMKLNADEESKEENEDKEEEEEEEAKEISAEGGGGGGGLKIGKGRKVMSEGVSEDDRAAFDQAVARANTAEDANQKMRKDLEIAQKELKALEASVKKDGNNAAAKRYMEKAKVAEKKLKETESSAKENKTKANRLEKELEKLKTLAAGGGGSGGGSGDAAKLRKEMDMMKKKLETALTQAEKDAQKEIKIMLKRATIAEEGLSASTTTATELGAQVTELKKIAVEAKALQEEVESLREKAQELTEARAAKKIAEENATKLDGLYKEEQTLRKKYFNMMEDMKGKIRVYARCRPMAKYELEKDSKRVVQFPDSSTVEVKGEKGTKSFIFDQCFDADSSQDEVFEDTKNLIQSSFDGFNVCVFAYGQTGSGKTWTMVGSQEHPGIVRRSIDEVFIHREKNKDKYDLVIRMYMLELYLDGLVDLLFKVKQKEGGGMKKDPPKLDIKKDKNGVVFVKGAETVVVETAEELLGYFEKANQVRRTASTQMNAGSSRSHLIFAVVLENTDKASKKTTVGKLSLVDLAGSERQDKTGTTGEQLKEAMSINKSLSALGDVISALSTNEKFIPYRNNKLTQLMSDSLGGNAKTLMFVNISPADYNSEETISSLVYASRVKLITNSAEKKSETEETMKLRQIIEELKANGGKSTILDAMEGGI